MDKHPICLLIPAYQPSAELVPLVRKLAEANFTIVVVNDGSSNEHQTTFTQLTDIPDVHILTHAQNKGKGVALKTGYQYILDKHPHYQGVVSLDADGQHSLRDVIKVAETLAQQPTDVILGVREFDQDVPWRSRMGNEITRSLFKFIYKVPISDTQTGLRGIPMALLPELLALPSKRYEFELESLIYFAKHKITIQQLTIKTIYIDDNASSHFNPVLDSLRIYFVFFRFLIISLLSFLIDFVIFVTLHLSGSSIFVAILVARLISSTFNFYNNKFTVYKSSGFDYLRREIFGYILLALFLIGFSYYAITFLHHTFHINVIIAKVIVDAFLFLVSFATQRWVIFRDRP